MDASTFKYMVVQYGGAKLAELSTNPDLSLVRISFLTFEAVLEVVIICFAGFIAAKTGLLNIQAQKVISQLNVDLFTPCLVFTKLAPSLSLQKMADIVIIPLFYALSTGTSYVCSRFMSHILCLNEPEGDFVTAMAVFGNSNSLPVSLTLSLAYTLPDLLWEDIEDDDSDKVASRGILYLLIFQQLGQVLRWSWGYNKLLRKRSEQELTTYFNKCVSYDEEMRNTEECTSLLSDQCTSDQETNNEGVVSTLIEVQSNEEEFQETERAAQGGASDNSSIQENVAVLNKYENGIVARAIRILTKIKNLPLVRGFLNFMNPPLYAMLTSVIVASIPSLHSIFFVNTESFVHNTVTQSIKQLGSVSIPLILIVLGSNLYPSSELPPPSRNYSKIVFGSLMSRMILPSAFLLPLIAVSVKYIKLSILDDPIFLIVAFILTISPPAIQLSQIVQLNNIYQKEMGGVLFWGYVILTLPTTILIVVASLAVLKWANA